MTVNTKQSIKDEEMVKLAFRALDKDGSGQVSTTEFKHLMTHIGIKFVYSQAYCSKCNISGEPLTEEEATWLIKAADKNNDGCLDFHELLKVMIGK